MEAPRCSVCLIPTLPLRTVDQAESVGTDIVPFILNNCQAFTI